MTVNLWTAIFWKTGMIRPFWLRLWGQHGRIVWWVLRHFVREEERI